MTTDLKIETPAKSGKAIVEESGPFFEWLAQWYDGLEPATFEEVFPDPAKGAILVEDLLIGFCRQGPLASERINRIVPETVRLLDQAHARGVTRFMISADVHEPDAPEFAAWPPHCVRGTEETKLVPELEELVYAKEFKLIEKNSLSTAIRTDFEEWLEQNQDVDNWVVTGDCTDLCTYTLAMHVRMWLNASNLQNKLVWVPAAAVETFDVPVPVEAADGGFAHPGDFTHMYFLYHMALNGIRVVSRIT